MLKANGLQVASVQGEALSATKLDARNTFDAPNVVHPDPWKAQPDGHGGATLTVPPASVVVAAVTGTATP